MPSISPLMIGAGARLQSIDGHTEGRLGLLVVDSSGRLFGISVLAIAEAGERPLACLSDHWSEMGAARRLVEPMRGAASRVDELLVLVPVDKAQEVNGNIPGVGNISRLIDPRDCFRQDFFIATLKCVPLGQVDATVAAVFLSDSDGVIRAYHGAVAIRYQGALPGGLAGAAVTSALGDMLGIVVAVDRYRLYVAPLARVLEERGFRPLTFEGKQHNQQARYLQAEAEAERARALADKVRVSAEQKEEPSQGAVSKGREQPPDSDSTIAQYDVVEMVEQLERAA